jgi:cell division protein FtsQ
MLRPAGLGIVALVLLLGIGWTVWRIDPAGRARQLAEGFSSFGSGLGLTVQEVVLEGRENTPIEFIRSALGIARGDPLLGFSLDGARERLETIAWVQRAHVERRLPGRIVVRLEERRPFAIWQHQGRFVIIDREGRTVATEGLDQFGPLPLVVGGGADRHAAELHAMVVAEPELARRVQALVRINERRWNIRLHNGMDILLPEGAERAAITRVGELQREAAILDRPLSAIDLRMPDRLVLRTTPQRGDPSAEPRPNPSMRRDRG